MAFNIWRPHISSWLCIHVSERFVKISKSNCVRSSSRPNTDNVESTLCFVSNLVFYIFFFETRAKIAFWNVSFCSLYWNSS